MRKKAVRPPVDNLLRQLERRLSRKINRVLRDTEELRSRIPQFPGPVGDGRPSLPEATADSSSAAAPSENPAPEAAKPARDPLLEPFYDPFAPPPVPFWPTRQPGA